MKIKLQKLLFIIFLTTNFSLVGQNIAILNQFNGRYDFTFVGNTLNPVENSFMNSPPTVLTTSSANLSLNPDDIVEKAYLYWAGCGTGDFDIKLNGIDIAPSRTFAMQRTTSGITLEYFSAFSDVTSLVTSIGNGDYTVSDLDVSPFITAHYQRRTNFAGWAIVIVYKNDNLPLNQINIYDGLQDIPINSATTPEIGLNINLDLLNVVDNNNAKIGFLAWEGDVGISVRESLKINGNIISNPPLNPSDNAFNGTNSITNSDVLYNMDLDVYNIENNIQIGDQSALIQLTSGQDFVMMNAIVTKLNNQLPDATIVIDNVSDLVCDSSTFKVDYTVYNVNSLDVLPTNIPIAIYANGILIGQTQTIVVLPIDGSENGSIILTVPADFPQDFQLLFVVDDTGNGTGIQTELVETNNTFSVPVSLLKSPEFNTLEPLIVCNEGLTKGTFNFSTYEELVKVNPTDAVTFYESLSDAELENNRIFNTSNYVAQTTPHEIFIRIDNDNCYSITSFLLETENCPPTVYNYFSPNNDGVNESFFIEGLRDVFLNFKIEIYNRWGHLVWVGDRNIPDWNGLSNQPIRTNDTTLSPRDTYFYILYLNDPSYPEPIQGWVYLFRKNR